MEDGRLLQDKGLVTESKRVTSSKVTNRKEQGTRKSTSEWSRELEVDRRV